MKFLKHDSHLCPIKLRLTFTKIIFYLQPREQRSTLNIIKNKIKSKGRLKRKMKIQNKRMIDLQKHISFLERLLLQIVFDKLIFVQNFHSILLLRKYSSVTVFQCMLYQKHFGICTCSEELDHRPVVEVKNLLVFGLLRDKSVFSEQINRKIDSSIVILH
jgi:hypothetical protein